MRSNRVTARASGQVATAERQAGFALIELVVAVAIMAIAFAGISTSLAASMSLRKSNQDTARAIRAALSLADTLRDEDFATLFVRYNESTADDPVGLTAPGANFTVPGLAPRDNDADGFVGHISFPGDGVALKEDAANRTLGMPRDLNGDGTIDAADHASDYGVLPVLITVEWKGSKGSAQIEIAATMTAR